MNTLAERLKHARTASRMTQSQLANRAGLSGQSLIGNLESGDQKGTTKIVKIAAALGVSPLWLATGSGESGDLTKVADVVPTTPDERRLLAAFRRLTYAQQEKTINKTELKALKNQTIIEALTESA